jgi:DNA-3-methyladenine glycosylase
MECDALRAEESVNQSIETRRRGRILPRTFYSRETTLVARELLGKLLVYGSTSGMIVETEAYPGGHDLASHSAAGLTNRTRVIFGPPGHAYVYLSYGLHACMNIVAETDGAPGCVLLRALEPVSGLDEMHARRKAARTDHDLASGPGKLTSALGITLRDYGADLTCGDFVVREYAPFHTFAIAVTRRIGITKCADLPLRFLIRGNSYVSKQHGP